MAKVKQLYDAITRADAWYIAGSPLLDSISGTDEPNENPENEVLNFTWIGGDEGTEFSESITEEDLSNATVNGNTITIHDPNGNFDIVLYKLVPYEIEPAPATAESDHLALFRNGVQFMQELLDSVETLSGIADQHGARTLADLMFLQNAILSGGFIDCYPGESKVRDIACGLPSGEQWTKFIKVEYMLLRPITHSGGVKSISDDDLCSRCCHCKYRPGVLSDCELGWPGLEDEDSYVQECPQFAIVSA